MTNIKSLTRICTNQTTSWLVHNLNILMLRRATNNPGFTRFTTAQTWGNHHLPPYNILCVFPWSSHLNDILSQDSPMGISKFSKLELLRLWGPITLRSDFRLRWGLKQSCSICWELSNDMLHATFMPWNRGDFWLLVIRSQIVNLTFDLSFGHNLCFKCLNG
jgi:hypothetical protein